MAFQFSPDNKKEFLERIAKLSPEKQDALRKLLERQGVANLNLPITPVKRTSNQFPLSFAQERLWFLDQLEGKSANYNVATAMRILGNLNFKILESALAAIIHRHEVLRTYFEFTNGTTVQVIEPDVTLKLTVVNLQHLQPEQLDEEVQQLIKSDSQTCFNLSQVPLIRVTLLQVAAQENVLLVTMHHIVTDGWSISIFTQELLTLYQAFLAKSPYSLANLPIQYADFAVWQRQWWLGEGLKTQLNYWKQQLSDAVPILELPSDRPRLSVETFNGNSLTFTLNSGLKQQLQALSNNTGTTLFMTLLAAFATLLNRYSSQADICIGSPIANRNRFEIEPLIGSFVNTLVLRIRIKDNPSFAELLTQVRQVALDAYEHQDAPFEKVVEALQPERNLSYNPLFQVMFILQNTPMGKLEVPGLSLTPLALEAVSSNFDITLSMEETEEGLTGIWEYSSTLFNKETIARMAENFQVLLAAIVTNPDQPIAQLPLLTDSQKYQLLVEWNNTVTNYPIDKTIPQLFEEQVQKTPDAIAVVFGQQQLTYDQLNCNANKIAHHLQSLGVVPEVLVGICVERSVEMVVGLLAILKAGGAYVPLDPAYPQERLAFMLGDAKISILLTQKRLLNTLPNHNAVVVCLDGDWRLDNEQNFSPSPITNCQSPTTLAYVIYTSGSTGKSKGVMVQHSSLVNAYLAWEEAYELRSRATCHLQMASFSFDVFSGDLVRALCSGGKLVLCPREFLLDPPQLYQLMLEQKVDCAEFVPAVLRNLIQYLEQSQQRLDFMQLVICGSDSWYVQEEKQIRQLCSSQTRLINSFGVTEATIDSSYFESKIINLPVEQLVPIGRPFANTQLYILDKHLQLVPIGVTGELYICGAGLARGYLNRPDLTTEKFIPNPFSNKPSSRLYKTGDLARYLPDGNIEFFGRIDYQVKIRGFRIELGEIEATLNQHPVVKETVVIAREDEPGNKRLVAYIVPLSPSPLLPLSPSLLRTFLKEQLPNYMMPSAFVVLEAMPLTPNGKVDRRALRAPNTARQELETDIITPRTESEEILAQIWREVLHLEQVGIHDNFFELGGDSILSIQIIFKANQAGFQLTVKQIFQHQTIAELAAFASVQSADCFRSIATQTVRAEQGLVSGLLPLTPIQRWFFEQNLPEPHHYNQSFLLEVPQTFDPALLSRVVQQLLVHHDALRLRFVQSDSNWKQINATPDDTIPFSQVNLSAIPSAEQKAAIEAAAASLQASLNLSSGPLMQVAFFALSTEKPSRLLIIIHHLAVDGVSWRILLEDLFSAYQQISRGEAIVLPPKTTSFKDWAMKLTNYAHSDTAKKELTYWQGISRTQINRLPVDNAFGANTVASARTVSVSLSPEETRALLQEVPKVYKTQINDILLTALVQVLGKWTGSNSVLLDLEGHGREDIFEDVDLSRTVGWFTTTFPVLLELKATDNLGDAIKSIKEQLRGVPNRGIGYGLLRYLSGDAEIISLLSAIPQAEVSFNYLGQFNWGMQSDSLFKLAPESAGSEHSQLGQHSHLLDINGLVLESQFSLYWTYSENFHSSATIESLAQDFAASLQTLIAHCLSAVFENQTIYSEAQQINNDQRQENNVPLPLHLLELPLEISELLPSDTESAYPLAKMQEFMLHHYTNDHQEMGVYHCQESYDIYDKTLDLNAFKKVLEISVQKHPTLRTVFITSNVKPAFQVVKKNLTFSINEQDISNIKSTEQENYIDEFIKQDRQNLFNVENPNEPLFRVWIFQKAKNRFELFMSIHHAITDGWSSIEFLNQLYELYSALKKGEEITVAPVANVYKEFVALEKEIIGSLDASNFWKLHLRNYTYKPLKPLSTSVDQVEAVAEEYNFGSEIIADLREFCRKLKVSPKAIFLSTYLDLIGTVMKENKVCVGIISNGRTERLSDPFGALGLFWNIVPFCQPTIEDKGVQIQNVQQSLIDIQPYVRYPLLQILSDQQKPELFFATFNFVHFHNAKNIKADTGLKVNRRRSHDKFNFPLNYAVSIESLSGNVSIGVEYDQMYFSCKNIRSMLQNYIEMVRACLPTL